MKWLKKALLAIGGFALFILFSTMVMMEAKEIRDITYQNKPDPAEAGMLIKSVEQSLFGSMNYFGIVLYDGQILDEPAELTKEQYESISNYESINGYHLKGTFYTDKDLSSDLLFHLILMILYCIYPFSYLFYQLKKWKNFRKMISRPNKSLKRLFYIILFCGLITGLLFSYFSMGKAIYHVYQSQTGELIMTEAEVVDKERYTGGRNASPTYYLYLQYADTQDDIIRMKKEVIERDYIKAKDIISIQYPKHLPLYITIQGHSTKDILSLLMNTTMAIYIMTFVLTGLLIYLLRIVKKRQKT